jgi:hypothetical protein
MIFRNVLDVLYSSMAPGTKVWESVRQRSVLAQRTLINSAVFLKDVLFGFCLKNKAKKYKNVTYRRMKTENAYNAYIEEVCAKELGVLVRGALKPCSCRLADNQFSLGLSSESEPALALVGAH